MDWHDIKQLDLNRLLELLQYNSKSPLLFNSGLFIFLFVLFLLVYGFVAKRVNIRVWFVVIFSLYFYYKSSGWYLLLMLATTFAAHILTKQVYVTRNPRKKKFLLIMSLVLYLGLLCYFKYTNFFIDITSIISGESFHFLSIFLPLGISFYTFELISYTVDTYNNKIKPVSKLVDFCFYVSFFPHLVAGPIVRPAEFIPQIRAKLDISNNMIGKGVFLIIAGLIKKAVISDYISSNFVDRIFENPSLYSGVENLLGVYGYTLQIYCDFSGYSDMAIGIAYLIGYHLPMNFNAPYQATSITDFWRRWHISLSSWLRDYLYIPLGGNRHGKWKQHLNLFITMLLGGLWHGANWKFLFWGAMHGIGLAIDKIFKPLIDKLPNLFTNVFGWIITFHFVAFCWIFFRAESFQSAWIIIERVFNDFRPQLFIPVITGYKNVFILIAIGYLLHFVPRSIEASTESMIVKTPLVIKAVYIVIAIWLVIQVKSAEVQPFIYFQF